MVWGRKEGYEGDGLIVGEDGMYRRKEEVGKGGNGLGKEVGVMKEMGWSEGWYDGRRWNWRSKKGMRWFRGRSEKKKGWGGLVGRRGIRGDRWGSRGKKRGWEGKKW